MIGLSIIIVNWNTKDHLLRCLQSAFRYQKDLSWEVIIVDNGSEDGSSQAIKELFPMVHLISNPVNLGFAKAANQGMKDASGRYLLLLNPDTELKEGSLERLVAFMEKHSDAGIAGGQLLNSDGSRQNSIANFPSLATELLNKSLLRRLYPAKFPGKERNYPRPLEVDSVIGACMIVRGEALEQVGPLDEDYFLFLEETDWCYRMRKAGWKVYYVPEAQITHFQGKGVQNRKKEAKLEYYRSRYQFFRKNRGRLQWFFLVAGLLLRLTVEICSMAFGCVITLGLVRGWRRRLSIYAYLMAWHLGFFPAGMGLRRSQLKGKPCCKFQVPGKQV